MIPIVISIVSILCNLFIVIVTWGNKNQNGKIQSDIKAQSSEITGVLDTSFTKLKGDLEASIAKLKGDFESSIAKLQGSVNENSSNTQKNASSIEKVAARHDERMNRIEANFNDLKSDLPFVYVLREDFVRSLNNVDKHMADISGKLDKLVDKR